MFISGLKFLMVRIEKPLPIRLEDTVCLEEGRAPGPSPLAMVLKDTAGTSGVSRVHVQERGLRGEAEEQGQPRRFMSGRCTTQTDWKDDQQGNLKEVWLDLLFLTTEGTRGKLSIAPTHPHFTFLGTTSSSEALASDKNMMNQRETRDASPLRPMGHHRRRWRLTLSILQSQLDQLPSFCCVQSSSFDCVRGGKEIESEMSLKL